MPFGVVSGVGRGMSVLDEGGDRRRGRGSFEVNVGHPPVTNRILCVRGGDAALPKLLWDFLLMITEALIPRTRRLVGVVTISSALQIEL